MPAYLELLKTDKGLREEGGLKTILKEGVSSERTSELVAKFAKSFENLGEISTFSGAEKARELAASFKSATETSKYKELAGKMATYDELIKETKVDAFIQKTGLSVSERGKVTKLLENDNFKEFMDRYIDTGSAASTIDFNKSLRGNTLFEGAANENGFLKLFETDSDFAQFIGREDAAERLEEFTERYPGGLNNKEDKYENSIRDIYTDKGGKYGDLYKNDEIMDKIGNISEPTKRDFLANAMNGINDQGEMELFLERLSTKVDNIDEAAGFARKNKTWWDHVKNRLGPYPKTKIFISLSLLLGGGAGIIGFLNSKDKKKCYNTNPECKEKCCKDENKAIGEFRDDVSPDASPCNGCVIKNSDVGGECARRKEEITRGVPPSPTKDDKGIWSFTYNTFNIKKWPKDCRQQKNNKNEKECWMNNKFQIYTGTLRETNYKYPTNKDFYWSTGLSNYADCKSCMGDWKASDMIFDTAKVYSYIDCEGNDTLNTFINTILGWWTCGKKWLVWLIIIGISIVIILILWGGFKLFKFKILPIVIWLAFTLYYIYELTSNLFTITKGKCTDDNIEDKNEILDKYMDVITRKSGISDQLIKNKDGLMSSIFTLGPMIIIQILIIFLWDPLIWLLGKFFGWVWNIIFSKEEKPQEFELVPLGNTKGAASNQGGGSRNKNKAFDVKNINRYTKGLIILSLIVAILITYFYKKNKENTIKKQYLNEIKKERSSRIENIKQMREKEKRDKEERAKQEANQGSFISKNVFGGQFI